MRESGKRKAESGGCAVKAESGKRKADEAFRPRSAFRPRLSAFPPAVTLIELLITMAIMAIISAAILGTASAAMEGARRSRTQTLVTKIHGLVTEQLASYETRRVEIAQTWTDPIEVMARNGTITQVERGQMLADLRLLAQRELMKYEMPDRWSDVTTDPVFLADRPPLAKTYMRRAASATGEYGPAECLYVTVMTATGDGEARTLFAKQDIGDTDTDGPDGAPEFVDGWGNPIFYARWAPGYLSRSTVMSGDADADHDPLDVYRRDDPNTVTPAVSKYPAGLGPYLAGLRDPYPAFRLVPLILAVGPIGIPDGNLDIILSPDKVATETGTDQRALNPYFIDSVLTANANKLNIPPYGMGMPNLTDGVDDTKSYITSHLNEY